MDTAEPLSVESLKILELEWTKDEATNRRVPEYLVHFNGWNSSWDRWAPANYILRYTDENLELKGKLHRQALAKMGKKKKKKTLAELVEQARRRQAGRGSDSEVSSGAADSDDSDESSSSEETEAVEIPIPLPDALKTKLEDDCYFISCKSKLVKLPCTPTILSIMEDYIRHFAINVQLHEKKRSQTQSVVGAAGKEGLVPPPLPKYNVDLCKEVMDGLRIIFDFILPTNLLYSPEKEQFHRIVSSCYVPNMAPVVPTPNKRGRPRKNSTPAVSAPARPPGRPPASAPVPKEDPPKPEPAQGSGEDPPRRVTRRLSTSGQIALAAPLPLVKRRCTDADHPPKTGPNTKKHPAGDAPAAAAAGAGNQPRDAQPQPKPALRHSTRLASTSSIPTSPVRETPPAPAPAPAVNPTPAATLNRSESTESGHSSSGTSGTKASSTGKNSKGLGSGDGGLDPKRLPSCKLLADDANYDGKMPLCKIYGAQHLMRLFVKLPELLGKMDLPPKKLRPLLKHIELFLKYLGHADRIESFFPESAYVNSQNGLQPVKTT